MFNEATLREILLLSSGNVYNSRPYVKKIFGPERKQQNLRKKKLHIYATNQSDYMVKLYVGKIDEFV